MFSRKVNRRNVKPFEKPSSEHLLREEVNYDRISESEDEEDTTIMKQFKKKRTLRICNIAAFALHATSFTVALILAIIYYKDSLQVQLTTDFMVYDEFAAGPPEAGPFSTKLVSLGYYHIIWLELVFPFVTAIFHALLAFVPSVNQYYTENLFKTGRNWIRWLEYSITASVMTWVILQLSGVTNIFMIVIVGVVANVLLQLQGYLMEEFNTPKMIAARNGKKNWSPTWIGWIIFVTQWVLIFWYFVTAVVSPRPPAVESVPTFVYVAIIALAFGYLLFGMVQLLHYLGWPKFLHSNFGVEIAYISLSFGTKFFLDWTLLIGIIMNRV